MSEVRHHKQMGSPWIRSRYKVSGISPRDVIHHKSIRQRQGMGKRGGSSRISTLSYNSIEVVLS